MTILTSRFTPGAVVGDEVHRHAEPVAGDGAGHDHRVPHARRAEFDHAQR
ncbi:hypothetical protein FHU38_002234 [Saccharomonospora amisosensis]|uniref:Uncharacterized protein n=1 Tax=Saccharomonospora amisosensis TaxID=1128677 RepID=A0A7X5ZR21_9PSEU|nr:hypothetical protein [Saccharomonospora amisosensis]NIJ11890.1 hypothetical protein [Saccharomonospora amisosensis]